MKINEFEFSSQLRKDTAFLDFVEEVRQAINIGSASVITNVNLTAQTEDILATTIYTPSIQAFFRVSVYMICTTAGTGTLSCIVRWTDPIGAKAISPASDVNLNSTANGSTGNEFIVSGASAITFETAIAGKVGNPAYSLFIVLEQLG